MADNKKIALVHYWLTGMRGGEKVVESICNVYPEIDIFTLVYNKEKISDIINSHKITTSFIQKMPFSKSKYRSYLPLMPVAIEQFDLSEYDIVISSESGIAKGVITQPETCHLCYVHTPMRYLWNMYFDYLKDEGMGFLKRNFIRYYFNYLRVWDYASASRVSYFMCNSNNVKKRIMKYYNREAEVIYPPIDVDRFKYAEKKENYYLIVSQLVSYKKVDLAIEAFNELGNKLVIVGEGQELSKLKKIAKNNIEFAGWQTNDALIDYYANAKAFVFPGEEDFGITPVEAQASGTPVIGFGKGGVMETVIDKKTGVLFKKQTKEDLIDAVKYFESNKELFVPSQIRDNSLKFSKENFEKKLKDFVTEKYKHYKNVYL